jgi:hypothetical protein
MNRLAFAIVAGLVFGAVDVATMLPLSFPDKQTALLAAFSSRFAIGFLVPLAKLPLPGWAAGAAVGFLISLPDAIVTGAYAPIVATGLVGGVMIGWAAGRFVSAPAGEEKGG